ncbi:MAG: DNA-(Apurinic or apyrimidinic site) lyase / pyrimidine dimer DNA glycosylase [Thermotoga sp. 50_1627]|nr:MAG: DNA-(Apurinic or apyrimidinic site) lyase / pyrimidine dimer DNA glycosylase [Thermotoga sp. 50_1627]
MALWREGLLAKKVLEGKTRGYRNHPQLERFKNHSEPLKAINAYLFEVWKEAERRGYRFDIRKIEVVELKEKILVTRGQLEYEFNHLLKKLQKRDLKRYETLKR